MGQQKTIGARVFLGVGACVGLIVILGITSTVSLVSLTRTIDKMAHQDSQKSSLVHAIYGDIMTLQSAQRGLLIGALTNDAQKIGAAEQQVREAVVNAGDRIRKLEPLVITEEGKQLFSTLRSAVGEYEKLSPSFRTFIREQRFEEANRMQADQFVPLMARMHESSSALVAQQSRFIEEAAAAAGTQSSIAFWIVGLVSAVSLIVAMIVLQVVRVALKRLRNIAAEIAAGARQVGAASTQVSSASQALAQGSSEQAASLEQTSASTEEINSMTQKNAENARLAASQTENADQLLKETDQKLHQLIESMSQINSSSERIGKIIRVIDEIAFQTNILALNAAVEAARAGEAGMGFAVVADEVRNLAQRCAQAAKDTSELIEESITSSGQGKSRLDEVASWIARVVENSSRIRVLANEVNLGSQEQARGIEQIARAVSQMQQVTQSVAASAEESASAGEEMNAQSMTLNDAVLRLRDLVGGEEAEPVTIARERQAVAPPPTAMASSRTVAFVPAIGSHHSRAAAKEAIPLEEDFRDF